MADRKGSGICPTCGHCHPGGMGLLACACGDCHLLWTTVPRELLKPEAYERLEELEAADG